MNIHHPIFEINMVLHATTVHLTNAKKKSRLRKDEDICIFVVRFNLNIVDSSIP